ncbi:hypothetical protein L5515_002979 [Caenorhabditis briggsae]|uniref:Glycerate kinase n=1 Tax=Caenorhabditis briggsae TaxID=6238 RepID=A0AAE9EH26_CAEBR|nr:hypothetical protein L5515_002979 [Caenorhabditis briggsae]
MTSRKVMKTAFERCLKAVNPREAVEKAITITPTHLNFLNQSSVLKLSELSKIIIISFGKASIQMAFGAQDVLQNIEKVQKKTFVQAPEQQKTSALLETLNFSEIFFGAKNNLPDQNSVIGTKTLIRKIQEEDSESTLFLFLISGGGSALLAAPRDSVTLEDKLKTIKTMQAHGATIQELNIVRQKLSDVKGGKLLRNIQKGLSLSLIISDVIGNPIELIASGPTVIPTLKTNILEILNNLNIQGTDLPESVRKIIKETEDSIQPPKYVQNHIISSNDFALRAASESLTSSGFNTTIVTSSLSGNAAKIGRHFADLITGKIKDNPLLGSSQTRDLKHPIALLFGGETTVHLAKNPGKGGRNQEMVLACLDSLKSQDPKFQFTFLSAGTDGQDGPTDAAGAIISNEDLLNPMTSFSSEYLDRSDSYSFWSKFNEGANHLKTGPSGTNVMDIQILLLNEKK